MDWISLISSLGFPIVACCCMAIYVKDLTKNNKEEVVELNKQHSEEMLLFKDEIKEALNNNTIALTKLCEKIDGKEGYYEVK